MSKFSDHDVGASYGTLGRPRKGFYTPSPKPRISNSPTLFFGDIGSFDVSNLLYTPVVLIPFAMHIISLTVVVLAIDKLQQEILIFINLISRLEDPYTIKLSSVMLYQPECYLSNKVYFSLLKILSSLM